MEGQLFINIAYNSPGSVARDSRKCDNAWVIPPHSARRLRFAAGVIAATVFAGAAAACSGISTPSTNKQQTFSGTVGPGTQPGSNTGNNTHVVTASKSGTLIVSVVSVSPDVNQILGIGYGFLAGSSCSVVAGGTIFTRAGGAQLTVPVQSGTYCVNVFDAAFISATGGLTATENYTINVSTP
jgi:hypothetical protein